MLKAFLSKFCGAIPFGPVLIYLDEHSEELKLGVRRRNYYLKKIKTSNADKIHRALLSIQKQSPEPISCRYESNSTSLMSRT
jgi:hypothetical protein